jgi:hypothetical protein
MERLMAYIIKNSTSNHYLARAGSSSSYTNRLEYARMFSTYEKAKAECCIENEYPLSVAALLPMVQRGD